MEKILKEGENKQVNKENYFNKKYNYYYYLEEETKAFVTTAITKSDIITVFEQNDDKNLEETKEKIKKLDDGKMRYIARKFNDCCMDDQFSSLLEAAEWAFEKWDREKSPDIEQDIEKSPNVDKWLE